MASLNHGHPQNLRLMTDVSDMLGHHCSLCVLFESPIGECDHWPQRQVPQRAETPSAFSDNSFYTARTSDSVYSTRSSRSYRSTSSSSSRSSTSTIRAFINPSPITTRTPALRKRASPTKESLRDLRAKHSEDCLQQVYQAQLDAFLNSFPGRMEVIEE